MKATIFPIIIYALFGDDNKWRGSYPPIYSLDEIDAQCNNINKIRSNCGLPPLKFTLERTVFNNEEELLRWMTERM